jgi:hypothetical protein
MRRGERTHLRKARENGYLDACCNENRALVHAYGLWCWRLKLPMVWLERRTRYSRYGRVQLEMFTSANRLTDSGQTVMKSICAPGTAARWIRVSPHDACWDHVAMPHARELAHLAFRAAIRPENYQRNEGRADSMQERKTGKLLQMAAPPNPRESGGDACLTCVR